MTRDELLRLKAWAEEKIATGNEPPWAWYQYMKLRETLEAIIEGMDATTPLGSPERPLRSENGPRLVASTDQQDTAQLRQLNPKPRLPM